MMRSVTRHAFVLLFTLLATAYGAFDGKLKPFTSSRLTVPLHVNGKRRSLAPSLQFGIQNHRYHTELNLSSLDEEKKGLTEEEKKDRLFWLAQARLAQDMQGSADKDSTAERNKKYEDRLSSLLSDTLFFTVLIFSSLWLASANPFTPISYVFGALLGTAYSYGLGKFVGSIGASIDDEGAVAGAGVGQARFAFLILLFIVVGKFRSEGLQELPAIGGFFTYQLASLSQGLKEYDD